MFRSDLIERKNTIIVNLALFHHMWQTYRDSDQYYDNVMKNVILETCASNLFFAKFFSPLLSQQCEPETPTRQSCCVVRKRWWFRNFPPPYSLIYFKNPTDSSFINRNDFSPLDSSSHQGIEQSVWILKLLY